MKISDINIGSIWSDSCYKIEVINVLFSTKYIVFKVLESKTNEYINKEFSNFFDSFFDRWTLVQDINPEYIL